MKKLYIVLCAVLLSGCATTFRAHQKSSLYFDTPKTITIMAPDMKISQLTAGGVSELIDEWSDSSRAKVLKLLQEELTSLRTVKFSTINELALEENDRYFLKEQKGLFNVVAYSIIAHTYTPQSMFKHKIDNFDYTMGQEASRLTEISGGDTLLFSSGCNYIWTAGRVGLSVLGALVGAATGATVIVPAGPEWFALALVDAKSGDVIWFDYVPIPGDLRDEAVIKRNLKRIFSSFPNKLK